MTSARAPASAGAGLRPALRSAVAAAAGAARHEENAGVLARLHVSYPGFELDLDLTLPGHGSTVLFGPSGCGKTTCLRCIAGLEHAPVGRVAINGSVWQDSATGRFVPTHQRPLGYVFQEASLFPHLSVRRNLAYGMRRVPAAQRRVSWERAVTLLGLEHLLERLPARLSGGERQRVGMARALLTSPQLLLMDEPLAALDLQRRDEILPYLRRLRAELDIPILYVTHAPAEVARLADHLVLLERGRVVAHGPLAGMLTRLDLPLARREDAGVVVTATVAAHDAAFHLSRLDFPGGSIWVVERPEPPGATLRVRIHARDVSLATTEFSGSTILNRLPVVVAEIAAADTPAHVLVRLDAGGTPLVARITRRSLAALAIAPGRRMWAQVKSVALLD